MSPSAAAPRLVMGIGCGLRGDDGVGPAVVRLLLGRVTTPDVRLVETVQPLDVIDCMAGAALVVIVDAVVSGAAPGHVHLLDVTDNPDALILARPTSAHGLGISEAVGLARALRRMPGRLVVVGVEGATFEHGPTLTRAVADSLDEAARVVLSVLDARQTGARAER